jgi:hypothetical protein
VTRVGTDKTFKRRFCWPAQDRVRANPLLKAPRKSPVFTASDFLRLKLVVVDPPPAASFATSMPSSELTPGAAGRRGESREELCCCAGVEYAGQALYRGGIVIPEPKPFTVRASRVGSVSARSTLAPDFFQVTSSARSEDRRMLVLHFPDWRVLGEQDDLV